MQVTPFGNAQDAVRTAGWIVLVGVGVFAFEYFWSLPGYFLIKSLFAVFFSFLSVFLVKYVLSIRQALLPGAAEPWFKKNDHFLILGAAILFVYSPLLTEGYYWYDDYWFYVGARTNYGISISIGMMRPFHGLLGDLFWFIAPSNAYFIKWFSLACLLGYAFMMYTWLLQKSGQRFLSLAITLALTLFSPLTDHLGYSATLSILPGMLAAGLSVILFDAFFEKADTKAWGQALMFAAAGGCVLVFSFMLHQVATPAVFLFLIMYIYFNQKTASSVRFVLSYMLFFGGCAAVYFLLGKGLIACYGSHFWERTGFIGIQDVVPKAGWFLRTVLPAVFDRLGLALLGRLATFDKCYWQFVQYNSIWLKGLVFFMFAASIMTVCASFIFRRKKIGDLLLLLLLVPMAYFPFLILKENGYLTYYSLPLLSVIFFFFTVAIREAFQLFRVFRGADPVPAAPGPLLQTVLVLLVCIVAFQNNTYIRQYWVETSKEGYHFLKNTLLLQAEKKKKIHVYGVLIPGQGNVYSIFEAKEALRELGYDPADFTITTSDNDQMISVIQANILEGVKKFITSEELQYILSNYIYDSTYHRYICNISDFTKLTPILIKTGLLPGDYRETIVVDLRWISPTWPGKDANVEYAKVVNEITPGPKNAIGHIEILEYVRDKDLLNINGWAAIENINSATSQVSILLKSSEKSVPLTVDMLNSPDVMTYFKNKNYGKCRFNVFLPSASAKIKQGKYEVWIRIVNEKLKAEASMLWGKPLEIK